MTKYDNYDSPTDLLLDKSITHEEKVEILVQWCDDEEALLRASAEGMGGGERPNLRQAKQALKTLLSQ